MVGVKVTNFRTIETYTCAPRIRRVSRGISVPITTRRINSAEAKGALFHTSPQEQREKYLRQLRRECLREIERIVEKVRREVNIAIEMANAGPGNRQDAPPKHVMALFKGLASSTRGFGEFRRVLHTGLYSQLVVMEVPVGGEIGDEVHTVDQILIFTSGAGLATVAGSEAEVAAGDVVVVPAGTQHQFVQRGSQPLELITVYSPAEHAPATVHKNKEQADKEEDEGIDEAPAWSRRSKKDNEADGWVKLSGKYD